MTRPSDCLALAAVLLIAACSEDPSPTAQSSSTPAAALATKAATRGSAVAMLKRVNAGLAARHAKFQVDHAEWVTRDDAQEAGQTVYANDRGNKHTGAHFVAGDPRRGLQRRRASLAQPRLPLSPAGDRDLPRDRVPLRGRSAWREAPCPRRPLARRAGGDVS